MKTKNPHSFSQFFLKIFIHPLFSSKGFQLFLCIRLVPLVNICCHLEVKKKSVFGSEGKEAACKSPRFNPWAWKISWRREWLSTTVFLPGEFHEQRSLAVYSPWGHKELDMAEWLTPTYLPPDLFSRITQAFGASIRSSDDKLNQTKRTEESLCL